MESISRMLRQYTIRLRMWGAVAMVLSILAVIGAVGLACGWRMQALNEEFAAHSIHEVGAVAAIRLNLAQVRLLEKQMVIDYEDGAAVGKHREAWRSAIEATRGALASLLEGAEDADNPLAREAIERLASYAKRSEPVLNNIQGGGYDTARVADRMLAKAKEEVAVVEQRVAGIAGIIEAESAVSQREFEATMRHALWAFGGTVLMALLMVAPLTLANLHSIIGPIGYAGGVAQAISHGDLSRPVQHDGRDEAAELLGALEAMRLSLREVVGQVHESSQSIEVSSTEVASGNGDLSQRTEQAAGSLQQTASSMEQLTSNVRQSAEAAGRAKELAASAASVAQRGGTVVSQVVSTMNEINSSSDQHPGAERRGGSRARRRAGPRLRGGGRRGAQPGAAQRRGGARDQGADRRQRRPRRGRQPAGGRRGQHDERHRRFGAARERHHRRDQRRRGRAERRHRPGQPGRLGSGPHDAAERCAGRAERGRGRVPQGAGHPVVRGGGHLQAAGRLRPVPGDPTPTSLT